MQSHANVRHNNQTVPKVKIIIANKHHPWNKQAGTKKHERKLKRDTIGAFIRHDLFSAFPVYSFPPFKFRKYPGICGRIVSVNWVPFKDYCENTNGRVQKFREKRGRTISRDRPFLSSMYWLLKITREPFVSFSRNNNFALKKKQNMYKVWVKGGGPQRTPKKTRRI